MVRKITLKRASFLLASTLPRAFGKGTEHQTFLSETAAMDANKESEPNVQFRDDKSKLVTKRSSRKTKIVVIGFVTVLLLLGAVVSVSVYFSLRKTTPSRLVEVNLEEGEILTYQVDQNIEIQGGDVQKGMLSFVLQAMVLFLLFASPAMNR